MTRPPEATRRSLVTSRFDLISRRLCIANHLHLLLRRDLVWTNVSLATHSATTEPGTISEAVVDVPVSGVVRHLVTCIHHPCSDVAVCPAHDCEPGACSSGLVCSKVKIDFNHGCFTGGGMAGWCSGGKNCNVP